MGYLVAVIVVMKLVVVTASILELGVISYYGWKKASDEYERKKELKHRVD